MLGANPGSIVRTDAVPNDILLCQDVRNQNVIPLPDLLLGIFANSITPSGSAGHGQLVCVQLAKGAAMSSRLTPMYLRVVWMSSCP